MAQIKTQIGKHVTFTQQEQRALEALDPKQKTKQIIFNITSQAVGTNAQLYVIEKMKTFKKILNQSTSERVVEIHEYATEALSQLNKLDPTKKDDKAKIIKAFFDQVCPESPPTVSCPPGENVVLKPIQGQVGGAQTGPQ